MRKPKPPAASTLKRAATTPNQAQLVEALSVNGWNIHAAARSLGWPLPRARSIVRRNEKIAQLCKKYGPGKGRPKKVAPKRVKK